MFKKILIANRGEIACRVIRTAHRMGIATVAVYSDADRHARHVEEAGEAVHIGAAPATESYLAAERIVQACRDTGAEAVHPGYGFLSENAGFVTMVEAAGVVFIGPGVHAIQSMGDKITSKRIAEQAGVHTIPGHNEVIQSADEAASIAADIGYPVMLKASAGGGGKGMRVAQDEAECRDGFERATSEAISSFGDGRIFIEKFIAEPRHIEIQLIADAHGNVVTLNERECSIQRRHQKVVEEAPSPYIDPDTRHAMSEQAKALARAVQYRSAGTVELVVDAQRNFYFLEMNTRLQVEHPVSELITGYDLVELMIRVAAGESLPIAQTDVTINGWSIESRIYAENPFRDFLPSTGRLVQYQPPEENQHVRVDTGVREGSEISMFYDPMIAKLITWAPTRAGAVDRMQEALDRYYIRGVETNLPFVRAIMGHSRFRQGHLTTHFIAEEYPDGFRAECVNIDPEIPAAVMASVHFRLMRRAMIVPSSVSGTAHHPGHGWVVFIREKAYRMQVSREQGTWRMETGDRTFQLEDDWRLMDPIYTGTLNGEPISMQIERSGKSMVYDVVYAGLPMKVRILSESSATHFAKMPSKSPLDLSGYLLSPMPGLLISVAVTPGQSVKAGEVLVVMEAMKMENVLRSERDAVVKEVLVEPGNTLQVDQPIIEFEAADRNVG